MKIEDFLYSNDDEYHIDFNNIEISTKDKVINIEKLDNEKLKNFLDEFFNEEDEILYVNKKNANNQQIEI